MCISSNAARTPDHWVGNLMDVALPVALRHHVEGNSVDVEVIVGHAVEGAVGAARTIRCDELADQVADGIYQAALRRGFPGSFVDLRLDLWHAMRQALA
jgi:hypothetical protein